MKIKAIIVFCIFLFPSFALSDSSEKVRLQLKWFSSFQFAGYYMALEKGYYSQSGLDVQILERDPTKNNILQVADGEAEYGVTDSAILYYRGQGKPLRVLASIFQHSPLVFIARKDSGIYSPLEMKGKIISYQRGLDDAPLLAVMQEANLNESDFIYKPLDFSNMSLVRGEVDVMSAYLSDQPFFMRSKNVDITIINPLNYGIDFYGDILITTQDEIDNHPERVNAFREASIKGWKYALSHKEETISILRTKYGARNPEDHLAFEAKVTEQMMVPEIVEIGYTSIERFYRIAEIYQRIGKLDKIQAARALDGLIYSPSENDRSYLRYLYIAGSLIILLAFATITLLLAKKRLDKLVEERTVLLSEALNFNETVLLNSPMPMGVFEASGRCILANDAYARLMGTTRESLHSLDFNEVDFFAENGMADLCRKVLEQEVPQNTEITMSNKSAAPIFLECRILPAYLNGKKHLLVQFVDLTERKRREEELKVARMAAEEATQLKNKFLSLVSHDLRSPLQGIKIFLEIFERPEAYKVDEAKRKEILGIIRETVDGNMRMLNRLLDVSKIQTGKMTASKKYIDLNSLVLKSIERLSFMTMEKGVEIKNELPGNSKVFADPMLMQEVFQNLISNSLKFTERGGSIRIFRPSDGSAIVGVSDTGVGIEKDNIPNIFRYDVKTSTRGTKGEEGSGLGLPLCMDIIKAHGGKLSVESERGRGSTFFINLPDIERFIVVADDQEIWRSMLSEQIAEITGLDVVEAENGLEVLEIIKDTRPFLILTDIDMPGMNGLELLEKIKSSPEWKNMPVIVTSALQFTADAGGGMTDVREKTLSLGGSAFLQKPAEVQRLEVVVRECLGNKI